MTVAMMAGIYLTMVTIVLVITMTGEIFLAVATKALILCAVATMVRIIRSVW